METAQIILGIVLIILAICNFLSEIEYDNIISGISAFIFAVAAIAVFTANSNSQHTYKVRELEKNTVFNITDSIGGFKPKDTVWVNYKKMMIDPLDSVAMQCVVIEELKSE